MPKSMFGPESAVLRGLLVEMRVGAGLTQRALAKRLGREHSFVARIEQGERRLDVVEFLWVCKACGTSSVKALRNLVGRIEAGEAERTSKGE